MTQYEVRQAKMISTVTHFRCPAAYKNRWAKTRCLPAKLHASASHTSTLEQQQQQRAFLGLKACTPVCLADIVELKPGCRALVAASDIQAGDTVLELSDCNSLCVSDTPTWRSVWRRDWLKPFEAAHGRLPKSLVSLITSTSLLSADHQHQALPMASC